MIAVIFEVVAHSGQREAYLETAARLRPLLEKIDGFISIERFESLSQPGKILSLSFWRDENAVAEWRAIAEHRAAQSAGRAYIFADYRLRVASVLRDYGMQASVIAGGGITEGVSHAGKHGATAGCVSGSERIPRERAEAPADSKAAHGG